MDKAAMVAIRNRMNVNKLPISTCNFRLRSADGLLFWGACRLSLSILIINFLTIQDKIHAARKNAAINRSVVVPGIVIVSGVSGKGFIGLI
jgi:hypothetical protein